MGFFDDLISIANGVKELADTAQQKLTRMQEFREELDSLSNIEVEWFYYTCKQVMEERGINIYW